MGTLTRFFLIIAASVLLTIYIVSYGVELARDKAAIARSII
jgi:hypothetical protein